MEYDFRPKFREAMEELDAEAADRVLNKVSEVADEGLNHSDVKLIKDRGGRWLYRLKIDPEGLNYRAFLDIQDGEMKFLDLLPREKAYEKHGNG